MWPEAIGVLLEDILGLYLTNSIYLSQDSQWPVDCLFPQVDCSGTFDRCGAFPGAVVAQSVAGAKQKIQYYHVSVKYN